MRLPSLGAVESLGLACDGRLLTLNSYENRVYQVGIEDAAPLIAKFYRPGRWSDEAILEEAAPARVPAPAAPRMAGPMNRPWICWPRPAPGRRPCSG